MGPNWEINHENMTRVKEGVICPVVALQVLYNQHQPAVDKIH